MYNLSLHIEYLLLRHDCVVLPNLGAFINVYHSAHFDEMSMSWNPMCREVRFNKALLYDDGLLANSYARKYQVSFQEGRELLRRDLESLKTVLDSEEELTLGNLGILKKKDTLISFIPFHKPDYYSNTLGYYKADVARETIYENKDIVFDIHTNDPSEYTEDNSVIQKFDTHRNYYFAINKTFTKVVSSLVIIFTFVAAFLIPISDNTKMDQASVLPVKNVLKSIQTVKEKEENAVESADCAPEIKEEEIDNNPSLLGNQYYLVVATFNSQHEADKFIEMNSSFSYNLTPVVTNTKTRVSAYQSDNPEDLKTYMRDADFKEKFGEAWIWHE